MVNIRSGRLERGISIRDPFNVPCTYPIISGGSFSGHFKKVVSSVYSQKHEFRHKTGGIGISLYAPLALVWQEGVGFASCPFNWHRIQRSRYTVPTLLLNQLQSNMPKHSFWVAFRYCKVIAQTTRQCFVTS
jgi:hypothetical protein